MTHKEFIFEAVKQLFNVELDENTTESDSGAFTGCWGFNCPEVFFDCEKCPYNKFWEKEV